MNITELREQVNNLNLFDHYDGLVSYGITTKKTNGVDTEEMCICLYVEDKKNITNLSTDQIIPETLQKFGVDLITDVIQLSKIKHLGDIKNTENVSIQPQYYHPNGNSLSADPQNNLIKRRPLLGGSSSSATNSQGDATLGLIVKDSTDGSIVLLSNNHVYADSQMLGIDALLGWNSNTTKLSVSQPGDLSVNIYASALRALDYVGIAKRCVPMTTVPTQSQVDCAIVQLSGYYLINSSSTGVVDFKFQGPYKFATTQEINSLNDTNSPNYNSPIFRSGRRLGALGYPGNVNSPPVFNLSLSTKDYIKIGALPYSTSLYYTSSKPTYMTDCFTIISSEGTFPTCDGGDSGSAVFALLSSNIAALSSWKCIGLLFASPDPVYNTSPGICCRIDNIAKLLNIEAWDGTIPTTKSKIANIVYDTYTDKLSSVTLSGRNFFNIGIQFSDPYTYKVKDGYQVYDVTDPGSVTNSVVISTHDLNNITLTINSRPLLTTFSANNLGSISGSNLYISSNPLLPSINFSMLSAMNGSIIDVSNNNKLSSFSIFNLTTITNSQLKITYNPLIPSIVLPVLASLSGSIIDVSNNTTLSWFSYSNMMTMINSQLKINYNPLIPSIDLPVLTSLGAGSIIEVSNNYKLTSFKIPIMTTMMNSQLKINYNPLIPSINLPFLTLLNGSIIDASSNSKLTSFTIPIIKTIINSQLKINYNPLIPFVELPFLTSLSGSIIDATGNNKLKSFTIPTLKNMTNSQLKINYNPLIPSIVLPVLSAMNGSIIDVSLGNTKLATFSMPSLKIFTNSIIDLGTGDPLITSAILDIIIITLASTITTGGNSSIRYKINSGTVGKNRAPTSKSTTVTSIKKLSAMGVDIVAYL